MGWGIWLIYLDDVYSIEPTDSLGLQKSCPFPRCSQNSPLLDGAGEVFLSQASRDLPGERLSPSILAAKVLTRIKISA